MYTAEIVQLVQYMPSEKYSSGDPIPLNSQRGILTV
jgi:hypothetical protein